MDRRFEKANIPYGKRYARSVFLQGLLASPGGLRLDTPVELFNLQKEYHDRLAKDHIKPVGFAVSFVANNDAVDYLLFGVDTEEQLQNILDLELYDQTDIAFLDTIHLNADEKWFDPRKWN